MFIVLVDNKYYVKKFEKDLFGGSVIHITNNEKEAAKLPESEANEVATRLKNFKKDTTIKRL